MRRWPVPLSFALVIVAATTAGHSFGQSATAGANKEQLSGRLTLTGSSTVAPLVAEIGKRFESLNPGVRVDVQSGGSARGIADARSGLADIGMVSRGLKSEEEDLKSFAIARDGIGMIVHRDNLVPTLSDEQVIAIYTGRLADWSEVGGAEVDARRHLIRGARADVERRDPDEHSMVARPDPHWPFSLLCPREAADDGDQQW